MKRIGSVAPDAGFITHSRSAENYGKRVPKGQSQFHDEDILIGPIWFPFSPYLLKGSFDDYDQVRRDLMANSLVYGRRRGKSERSTPLEVWTLEFAGRR